MFTLAFNFVYLYERYVVEWSNYQRTTCKLVIRYYKKRIRRGTGVQECELMRWLWVWCPLDGMNYYLLIFLFLRSSFSPRQNARRKWGCRSILTQVPSIYLAVCRIQREADFIYLNYKRYIIGWSIFGHSFLCSIVYLSFKATQYIHSPMCLLLSVVQFLLTSIRLQNHTFLSRYVEILIFLSFLYIF